MYAWRLGTKRGGIVSQFHVPSSFSCPSELAVGRWLWKAAQNCNDFNNVGRDTETFGSSAYTSQAPTCPPSNPAETFVSCFDFKVVTVCPTPQPTPAPTPQPAQCCTGQGGACSAPCSNGGWCGISESNCVACAGSWCRGSDPVSPAPTPVVNPTPTPPAPT